MSNCLTCKNPIESTPGRRPKVYCSNNCKQKDWQRKNNVKKENEPLPAPKSEKPADTKRREREVVKGAENGSLVFPKVKKKGRKAPSVKSSIEFKPQTPESYDAPRTGDGLFMGIEIPSDLVGIDLSIWKAEIKDKNK